MSPFPLDNPLIVPTPMGACTDGMGWDFEDGSGTHEGWTPTGVFGNAIPVFGNNVSVSRLHPPGMSASAAQEAETAVGGDYWEFSRDVNQRGDFWIGTTDTRRNWTVAPGVGRIPERETGTLTSPVFVLASKFLTFRVGGVRHAGQRVELWVLPQDQGDQARLFSGYEGVETDGTIVKGIPPGPLLEAGYVRALTATAAVDGEWMGTTVQWDVGAWPGRNAFLRVVDELDNGCALVDAQGQCVEPVPQHINVDGFSCQEAAVVGAMPVQNCTPNGCTPSTRVSVHQKPQPLWGTTEAHSHPAANKHFGGHMFWGDVTDELKTVYNCSDPSLPPPHGHGAADRPPYARHSCGVSPAWTLGVFTSLFTSVCVPLTLVPVAGWALGGACSLALSSVLVAASFGVMTGRTYHGASALTSGGITLLEWLSFLTHSLGVANISGVVEGLDWDRNHQHSGQGLTKLHQIYQYQLLQRAWQGGLRLMVADAENGRLLQELLDRKSDYGDWNAIADVASTMERLTDPVTGPARSFAQIARSPQEARAIIAQDKLAIILGVEVQELGKKRFSLDSVERQVQDLYAMGFRKITPIHGINNPLGGTSIFNDVYNSNNLYANTTLTPSGATLRPTYTWGPSIPVFLPFMPPPFSLIPIASTNVLLSLGDRVPEVDEPTVSRGTNFVAEDGLATVDWIGGGITYRAGMENTHAHLSSVMGAVPPFAEAHSTNLSDATRLMHVHWVDPDLNWMVGGTSDACRLGDMLVPLDRAVPPEVQATYAAAPNGHRNVEGLSLDGKNFLREMMRHGMIVDVDHMSQKARVTAFGLAEGEGYPLHAIHVNIRPYEKNGVVVMEQAHQHGSVTEITKPRQEIERIVATGGTASPAMWGSMVDPILLRDGGEAPAEVMNDCDFSSKSMAVKYLLMMKWQQGRGLTPSTDMGFAASLMPRFGQYACHQRSQDGLEDWRRDWTQEPYAGPGGGTVQQRCLDNMLPTRGGSTGAMSMGPLDSYCPSSQMLAMQEREFSGVWYDDYVALAMDPTRSRNNLSAATRPTQVEIVARRPGMDERRDDNAQPAPWDQEVYTDSALQLRPLRKFRTEGAFTTGDARNTGWDFNLDGLAHMGLYPDLFQDMRNVGVSFEQMTPLFNAAEEYVRMWERACASANVIRAREGLSALPGCEGY
jgi:microsomal dipeptidase-like Zn-dependent dipeptidase